MHRPEQRVERLPAELDTRQRWVRVTGERGNGFVEFDFAVGEPELCVEMILPAAAFAEFCAAHRVALLPPREPAETEPPNDWHWRLADATQTRFKA